MGATGRFVYDGAVNISENLMRVGMSIGNPSAAMAIMGASAFGDTVISGKQRGLSDKEILGLGITTAAVEALTEKMGIDALLDGALLKKNVRNYILKGAISEAGEEAVSEVVGTIADNIIAQDKSEWRKSIQKYREEGYGEDTAFAMAYRDKALETGRSALLGAMSGAGMSGGVAIVNSVAQAKENRTERKLAEKLQMLDMLEENEKANDRMASQQITDDMQDNAKSTSIDESYRIGKTTENQSFVAIEEDILEGVKEENWTRKVSNVLKEKFPKGITVGKDIIKVNQKSRREMTFSGYMQWLRKNDPQAFSDKLRAANNADEIVLAAENWVNEGVNHERKDTISSFARANVLMKIGNNDYSAEVVVGIKDNGEALLYDVINLKSAEIIEKETGTLNTEYPSPGVDRNNEPLSADSIPQTAGQSQENTAGNIFGGNVLPTAKEAQEQRRREARAAKAKTEVERTGILLGVEDDVIQTAKRVSKVLGIGVRFYKSTGKDKGYYNHNDGKIYLNANTKDPIATILGHEMIHDIQRTEGYMKFFSAVIKDIQKSGTSLDQRRAELQARYKAAGVELKNIAKIDQDVVAEYAQEHLFTNEASIVSVVNADAESGHKIVRFLDNVLAKLGNESARERAFVQNARALYAKALKETAERKGQQNWKETVEAESERMRAGSQTEAASAKTETSSETAREKHPIIRENVLPTAAERFESRVVETQEEKPPQSAELTALSETLPQSPTVPAPSEREPVAEDTETAREAESRGAEGMAEVEAIVSENLRPEITGNAELMEMLRAQFGADGTAALARQIKAEVEKTGTVGRFGVLFSDGGMAVEEALGANDGGRQYSISKEESNSVREQVNTHLGELNAMESVASIKSAGRNGLSKDGFRKKIVESLRSTGFKVDRQGLGLIQFTEREINNSLNYMQTEAEFAAYQALPKVLKRGIEIGKHENHKGREYGTITIAAPIEINGERANMAVVVKQTKGNRYKVHRVLTPEGGTFKMPDIKNAEPTTGGGLALKDTHARPISSTSKKSITNGNEFVNTLDENIQYAIIKGAEETEILEENAELMEMLRAQFGADGTVALARQIKAEVERTGTVGRFGVLFSDGGMAVEEALGADNVSNGGERQFSISKDEETEGIFSAPQEVTEKLSAQVDAWLQGGMRSDEHFDFGKTPEVLKQLGAQNLPIVMNQSVMVKITGGSHAIALDTIKDIPNAMADPVMIFKSDTVKNAFVVLTEHDDKSGDAVVVALHLNREEKHIRVNRVASIYGKENVENFIQKQTTIGNLKYIDKNKSQVWSQSRGLQLPKLADTNPDNNIILYKENVVNRYRIKKSGKYAQNAENKSFSISEKQENGRQYSIGKEKGVANRSGKRYNKKQIRMNSQEHTLVKSAIMKKESGRTDGDVPTVDSVYAYDKYYLYEPTPGYDGIVFARFDPIYDQRVINEIEEGLKSGTIRDKKALSGRIKDFRSGKRFGVLHNGNDENGRTSDGTTGIHGSELGSNDVGYSGGGIRNQSGIGLETETDERQYAITKKPVEAETAIQGETEDSADFWDEWLEKVKEYGAMEKGEKPARDIEVPKKIGKNKPVSQTVRTILEAKVTPDEAIPTIEQMVLDGEFSYDVHTDKKAIKEADGKIEKRGYIAAYDAWAKDMDAGKVSKENTALGWALYNQAATSGDIKTATTILNKMVQHQRNAAQALQATRILKQLSPEGQLYQAVNAVEALQQELKEKYGDKAPDLEINENLAKEFLEARTQKERDEIKKKIYRDIGRQMPSRFIDKWNAWRYLAMLGNPRTHIRNIVGNAGFAPVVAAKNLAATTVESIVYRVSGGKMGRTKAFIVGTKYDRDLLKAAWNDYKNVAEMISNGGKYSDAAMANRSIEEGRRVFKFVPLEAARKGNSWLLEVEDVWFSKPHYAYALAQYCKANHISLQSLEEGKLLDAARPRFFFFWGKNKNRVKTRFKK